jgi:hypothetical protein
MIPSPQRTARAALLRELSRAASDQWPFVAAERVSPARGCASVAVGDDGNDCGGHPNDPWTAAAEACPAEATGLSAPCSYQARAQHDGLDERPVAKDWGNGNGNGNTAAAHGLASLAAHGAPPKSPQYTVKYITSSGSPTPLAYCCDFSACGGGRGDAVAEPTTPSPQIATETFTALFSPPGWCTLALDYITDRVECSGASATIADGVIVLADDGDA